MYINNGTQKKVGDYDCSYPLSGSYYNHKSAQLDDFTPKYVKDILKKDRILRTKDAVNVSFNGRTNYGGSLDVCYIRFYLDSTKTSVIEKEFGQIPDNYKTELYKGLKNASLSKDVVGYSTASTLTFYGREKNDPCTYMTGQVDWEALKNVERLSNYYKYKEEIEMACLKNNINPRLLIAHSAHETGCLTSVAWKERFNPAGLLAGNRRVGETFTQYGIKCTVVGADNIGVDGKSHGKFIKINTSAEAWELFAAWVSKSSYYGVSTKNLKTVEEYVNAMEWGINGGPRFCGSINAHCTGYADSVMNFYVRIPST